MKRASLLLLIALLLPHAGRAQALANDASILDVHWSGRTLSQWNKSAGKDGPEPVADGDNLILSMEGATDGSTYVRKVLTTPTDFILTTRVAIDKFPETSDWGTYPLYNGIQLARAYQDDTIIIQVGPDAIHVASWINNNKGTIIPLTTEVGKFYTWQFEISQAEGEKRAGTVTIHRREDDMQPWELVEAAVPILDSDFGDDLPLAVIFFNPDNPDSQGSLRQQYFLAGVAAGVANP